jgi:hypothetical protein
MGVVGDIKQYLTQEDLKTLMNVRGKNLSYDLSSWEGYGFWAKDSVDQIITPFRFETMATQIAMNKPSVTDEEVEDLQGENAAIDALQLLAKRIIELSNSTEVDKDYMEELGIGETVGGSHTGQYKFWDPEYERLYQEKKLVIKGYVETLPWDLD